MTPSVGKKLGLFIATVVLLATAAVGYVSYSLLEAKFAEILRKDTLDAATLLSSRVRNELRHLAEKGRVLAAAALEEFKNPDDQIRFLEDNLAMDDQLVAMTLFRRSKKSQGLWEPVFRLTRPEGDPTHLEESDFKQLDLKYPVDFGLVGEGAVELTVGALKDATPILRLAVPIVKKKGEGFTQLLGLEVRQERLTAAFAESTAHFSFILDRHGRVLTQTDPTHFTFGEDLSHLPILQMARTTEAPNGNLDYYELPGGPLQYGSFHKVGYADLIVVTQAPRTHIIAMMRTYTRQAGLVGFACVFLASAFGLLAAWGIVGARLARIGQAIHKTGDGRYNVHVPEAESGDEVGDFSRKLQALFDELRERERVHGTFAKLHKNKRVKAQVTEGKLNLKGERMKALVLHAHIHGLDAVVAKADPELLIKFLNKFSQAVSDTVERNHGIVDYVHGGSIVAFWGVPAAEKDDPDRALCTVLEIRKFFKQLNESFKKQRLPAVTLGMGMHYGAVVAGQVGTDDRLEYTALGEALEVASRIRNFTDQFGTDFLMTGAVVDQAPKWYSTEKVSDGDENGPELFELVGSAAKPKSSATVEAVEEEAPAEVETEAEAEAETAAEAETETAAEAETETETAAEAETETAVEEVAAAESEPAAEEETPAEDAKPKKAKRTRKAKKEAVASEAPVPTEESDESKAA